jgi:hypothetical protein
VDESGVIPSQHAPRSHITRGMNNRTVGGCQSWKYYTEDLPVPYWRYFQRNAHSLTSQSLAKHICFSELLSLVYLNINASNEQHKSVSIYLLSAVEFYLVDSDIVCVYIKFCLFTFVTGVEVYDSTVVSKPLSLPAKKVMLCYSISDPAAE